MSCILDMITWSVFCYAIYLLRTVCSSSNFLELSIGKPLPILQSLECSSLSIWVGTLVEALPDMRGSSRKVLGNRKDVFAKSRMFRINVSSNKSRLCQICEGLPETFWKTGKIYFLAMERNTESFVGIGYLI